MTPRLSDATRRGFLAALLGGGTAATALSPAAVILERVGPLSGTTWHAERDGPTTVTSPHGEATVTYDEHHVPHVEADAELAAYYALGYAQAGDRLFEMDVLRRSASGSLSAVIGDSTVEQDVLKTKLDFRGAAEASARALEGTDAEPVYEAFAAGVTAYIEANEPGLPFGLLDYEPEPWGVVDSLLVSTTMSWKISGSFGALREAAKRETFDADTYRELYPREQNHDVPTIRDDVPGANASADDPAAVDATAVDPATMDATDGLDPAFVDWVGTVEADSAAGSNAWLVDAEHTEAGRPLVCSDPHLMLQAPPIWYEQELQVGGLTTRGVTIPGVPVVVLGENDHGAWAMTAAQVSQADLYSYETDGDRYRYRDEWREFDAETRTVEVAGGEDRDVTVRKTVHGPFLDREVDGETHHVGVSWVGFAETRDPVAFYRMTNSTGRESFRDAVDLLDVPTLNYLYADTDDRTLFQTVGRVPIREVDGEMVPGDRVFDGSTGEGEWTGFEPFGESSWDEGGFVPTDEMPSTTDQSYVASGNQRIVDDPAYPLGSGFANGYRAERMYERLDETVGAGETVDLDFCESLQLDTDNLLARELVPALLDVRDRVDDAVADWLDELEGWDHRMDRDSTAALVFYRCHRKFREAAWTDFFADVDLGRRFWPSERVLFELPADSHVFDGDRGAVLARAATAAAEELDDGDAETYGDVNTTAFDHHLGSVISGLNYPEYPTDGDWLTVRSVIPEGEWGASYRMVSSVGGETRTVLPGGNDGSPLSDHYHDQLRMWADGEYRAASDGPASAPDLTFEEGDR